MLDSLLMESFSQEKFGIKKIFWLKVKAKGLQRRRQSIVKPAALFFLGIILFLLLAYCGLYTAEKGILELTALQSPAGALYFKVNKDKIIIIFAGHNYYLSFNKINQFLFNDLDISPRF